MNQRMPIPRLPILEHTNAYRAGLEMGREQFNGSWFCVGLVIGFLSSVLIAASYFWFLM